MKMKRFIFAIIASMLNMFLSIASVDNSFLLSGNAEYENGNYDKAIENYEKALQNGESAALYYNLGNSYYKKNCLGSAILNYERAILLEPNNEDIIANLEIARSQTVDEIRKIDSFFLSQWWDDFKNMSSSDGWAVWSIVFLILVLVCASLYLYLKIDAVRRFGFFGGCISLICCVVCMICASAQKSKLTAHNYAIIFAPTVTAKTAPETNAKDFFTLHEGTKVRVKQTIRKWIEIEFEDGNSGWIQDKDARKI